MLNVFSQTLAWQTPADAQEKTNTWVWVRFNDAQAEPNTLAFCKQMWFAQKIFPKKKQIFLHVPSNQGTETKRKIQKWRGVPRQASLERNHGMLKKFDNLWTINPLHFSGLNGNDTPKPVDFGNDRHGKNVQVRKMRSQVSWMSPKSLKARRNGKILNKYTPEI